jgi:hypothetical protein
VSSRRHLALRIIVSIGLFVPGFARVASAQDQPFAFTITTPTAQKEKPALHYDVGVGRHDFVTGVEDGVEQQVSIQADLTRGVRLIAGVGLSLDEEESGGTNHSQRAELLVNVLHTGSGRSNVAIGGGILHEYTGVDVLRARVLAGHQFSMSQLHMNLLFEKPFAGDDDIVRDKVDVLTSIGWLVRASSFMHVGVEAVGQDLEGFWEEEEAEGGARLLIGPSLYVQPTARRWRIGVSGGPVIRATRSDLQSGAPRQLPSGGFAVRTSFSYLF